MSCQLYLYTDNNTFSDYLSTRTIASYSIIGSNLSIRTIANSTEDFLFVTHLKLCRDLREQGLLVNTGVNPITLGFTFSKEQFARYNVVFVRMQDGKPLLTMGDITEYDESSCIGAFIPGEIPFSCLNEVIFDSIDEQQHLFRMSDDYWYPEELYRVSSENEFADNISLSITDTDIWECLGTDKCNELRQHVKIREKYRAALLGLIDATQKWTIDNFRLNMEPYLQRCLWLSDELIEKSISNYPEIIKDYSEEKIDLLQITNTSSSDEPINSLIYRKIYDEFMAKPANSVLELSYFKELYDRISFDFVELNQMTEVKKFLSGNSLMSPEELLSTIPDNLSILKAFVLIAKNPSDFVFFIKGFKVYSIDPVTVRRAVVLWFMLNGLSLVSGSGFNKDNSKLWNVIDIVASVHEPYDLLCDYIFDCNEYVNIIPLYAEDMYTPESVFNILHSNIIWLTDDAVRQMIELKMLSGKAVICHKRIVADDIPFIKKGEIVSEEVIKSIENIIKASEKTESYDYVLIKERLFDKKTFLKLYAKNKDFFIRMIKRMRK